MGQNNINGKGKQNLELVHVKDYPKHDYVLQRTMQEMNARQKNDKADYDFPRFYDNIRWHRKACCYAFAANAFDIPELQPGMLAMTNRCQRNDVHDLYKKFIDVAADRAGFAVFAASIEALIRLDGFESLGHDPKTLCDQKDGLSFALFFAQLVDERSHNYYLPHHDFHVFALRRRDDDIVMAHKFRELQETAFDAHNSVRSIFTQAAQVGYNHFAGYYRLAPPATNHISAKAKAIIAAMAV